ncbi:zinc-finger domain-containing protein [Domibacillus sp. 8LH]|uniref:zinc-finger domain-containing protein n=1 Tax=Domibacillus TaxID=1433999 RepID=UPI001F572178|nr:MULTISPECIES: zinc-finger domain-containing protein [Domibacillus]MCI2254741.1 zinc-finger domain-containing protein [Domibacillus sp. PGB-M46]MCM3788232.1 zinc-finger domain-containing protein [Domibacillus indicus]WNS82145.1 zinc-finger domain-containing protein [Domibacillus sp. DTU_2020_1001157_1_SI_ALB_TIR_016]
MNRTELLLEVEELLNTYCKDCLVKNTLRKERGKTAAHKFCITQCTIGEKLKQYGDKLS